MFREAPADWIRQIYVSERFRNEHASDGLLRDRQFEVLSDHVFETVSDTRTPQGVLCLLQMPEYTLEDIWCSAHPHILLLESIQDPGNLGTMIRTGEGAGISGIIMNRTTVDIYSPKVVRATMGSIFRVPFVAVDDFEDVLCKLRQRGVKLFAAHLEGAYSYTEADYTSGCAFLVGNEGSGLSDAASSQADCRVRIPMEGRVESLNAAIAATLLMYEAARQRR